MVDLSIDLHLIVRMIELVRAGARPFEHSPPCPALARCRWYRVDDFVTVLGRTVRAPCELLSPRKRSGGSNHPAQDLPQHGCRRGRRRFGVATLPYPHPPSISRLPLTPPVALHPHPNRTVTAPTRPSLHAAAAAPHATASPVPLRGSVHRARLLHAKHTRARRFRQSRAAVCCAHAHHPSNSSRGRRVAPSCPTSLEPAPFLAPRPPLLHRSPRRPLPRRVLSCPPSSPPQPSPPPPSPPCRCGEWVGECREA